MRYGDHAAFVDALRSCLDLDPLYDRSDARRKDVERFGGVPLHGVSGYDGNGCRRTERARTA